jgi:hypothetical protein
MVANDVLVNVAAEEEQDVAVKHPTAIKPDQYSDNYDMEQGIIDPTTRPLEYGTTNLGMYPSGISSSSSSKATNIPKGNAADALDAEPASDDASPHSARSVYKQSLITSFWGILSFAPIMIAFNVIINTHKKPYFFGKTFFGFLLFDITVMVVCMVVWTVVYGLIVLPIGKWWFPECFKTETVSSQPDQPAVEIEERPA